MAKELKIEITITRDFVEDRIHKLVVDSSEGGVLEFMSLMILRSELERLAGKPLKIHTNDLLGAEEDHIAAVCKSLSMIIGVPRLKDNNASSGKTIEDIINGEPDEE